MRGYIYNIEADPDNLGITESQFYEHVDALGADYVQDVDPDQAAQLVKDFAEELRKCGFLVTPFQYEDDLGETRDGFMLETGSMHQLRTAQAAYFGPRMKQLKEAVRDIDPIRFCSDGGYAIELRNMIVNPYADVVHSQNDTCKDLDDFIRDLVEGEVLYIGPDVVLMH